MIKRIISANVDILQVGNSGSADGPYQTGAMYWNGNTQKMYVITSDGVTYGMYDEDAIVAPGPVLTHIIEWAQKKMKEDEELDKLCKAYPNLDDARKEFAVLHRLVKDIA